MDLFLFGVGEKPSRCHRCQAQSKPVYRGPHNSTLKFTAGKNFDHACLINRQLKVSEWLFWTDELVQTWSFRIHIIISNSKPIPLDLPFNPFTLGFFFKLLRTVFQKHTSRKTASFNLKNRWCPVVFIILQIFFATQSAF